VGKNSLTQSRKVRKEKDLHINKLCALAFLRQPHFAAQIFPIG
jgi:hypothetical protein